MAREEDIKVTKMRASRLFLGNGNGNMGKEVLADANEINGLQASITREDFSNDPRFSMKSDATGVPTGTAGDENFYMTTNSIITQHIIGTQTIILPVPVVGGGWDIEGDQTEDEGYEFNWGGLVAGGKCVFKVGTSAAFFARLKFNIADVSFAKEFAFGFRTVEAFQAAIDNYNNMAVINCLAGDFKIETIDDNNATTTTDTTDNASDATDHTIEVRVSAAGVVTYLIDGVAPTTTAAFTIDDGDNVCPFLFYLQGATTFAGDVILKEMVCGLQADDPDPATRDWSDLAD
jgi:hypothetical protein